MQQEEADITRSGFADIQHGVETFWVGDAAIWRYPRVSKNFVRDFRLLIVVETVDAQHYGQYPPIQQIASLEKIADGAQQLVKIVFDVVHEKSL